MSVCAFNYNKVTLMRIKLYKPNGKVTLTFYASTNLGVTNNKMKTVVQLDCHIVSCSSTMSRYAWR